jgi:hypothetical protein
MNRLFMICLVMLVSTTILVAQHKYEYEGPFPPSDSGRTTIGGIINVGIGVDPAGKVWVQTRSENTTRDSITTGAGTKVRLFPIRAFNPNGTEAGFSPINILSHGGETDTMLRSGATGGSINPFTGNFVAVWGTLSYKPGPLLWEVDYKTGAGANRILFSPPTPTTSVLQNNIASVGVTDEGEYVMASVLGGTPGMIVNADGSAGTNFAASVPDIGRAIAVAGDASAVYVPRFTSFKTFVYKSASGSLGPYTLQDSVFLGASIESIALHPTDGTVWVIADRRSVRDSIGNRTWSANWAYGMNPTTKALVDSFWIHVWPSASTGPLPRGMAFSPTGDTLYVGHFDVSTLPAVNRYIYGLYTKVSKIDNAIPEGFELKQNYPNPFNPTTEIEFTIPAAGMTTLRVYDMLGREVAMLVNEHMPAGTFKATFNARDLTSGTYIYEVVSGSTRLTKRMMLVK